MNAALFYGPNDIRIKDVNTENHSNKNILLKTLSCSVCSYDVRTFRNGSFKVSPPVILGHEICARTIDDYESKNFSIKSGTRVSIYPVIPCLNCWYCNNKMYNLCSNLKEIGSTVNGGFAEYISIPRKLFDIGGIIPVLDDVSNEEASLVEPLACCINGINQIKRSSFESAVILGDGPIGLMQLMLLKKYFPKMRIVICGKIKHRLDSANRIGADMTYLIDEKKSEDENIKTLKEHQWSDFTQFNFCLKQQSVFGRFGCKIGKQKWKYSNLFRNQKKQCNWNFWTNRYRPQFYPL